MNAASYQSKLQIPSNNRAGEREGGALIQLGWRERSRFGRALERINLIYLSFIWLSATPPDVRQWRRR